MNNQPKRIKRGWMTLKVSQIDNETHDTKTLHFVDAEEGGRQFDYIPGQYLTFRFDDISDKPVVRSYTMSSSPCQENFISVTVKEIEDGFISKHLVRNVKVGDLLRARGPIGKFCYHPKDEKHLVMFAAGSGVTPFLSALREYSPHLGEAGYPTKLSLLVGYRSRKDWICKQLLQESAQYKGVQIVTTLSQEDATAEGFWHGRIDAHKIDKFMEGNYQETTYMTCGPGALMELTATHLRSKGVHEENIKSESFD